MVDLGSEELRSMVLDSARRRIGTGRSEDDDFSALGPDVSDRPIQWCGIGALAVYHEAGLGLQVLWRISFGFSRHLRLTQHPEPADLVILPKREYYHEAIIEELNQHSMTVIAANTGMPPGKWSRGSYTLPHPGALFFSIQGWIDAVMA